MCTFSLLNWCMYREDHVNGLAMERAIQWDRPGYTPWDGYEDRPIVNCMGKILAILIGVQQEHMTCTLTLPFKSSTVNSLDRNRGADFIPISATCFRCLKRCKAFLVIFVQIQVLHRDF
ncbi:uncharacterized protein LACBIDRAFT_321003 [Laccaria bicolor S238N-H82]|uniref:Predicted protein n=1 Tax=Laccaria bicolor (strain S238N-H82 / ATCC MYA-4686) TaxID=486041 RepID=B0CNG7_LACBS|nr:uncharacterized protein LACBIDRAFT_321003 [Laccaria bicolor S238N-H82]EDR15304.1 predicted protein [Laccaria bicolor S238N-H82]|eukprot:XP_001873512.1 predicted protein [Laccaria bicolor S238N-H82]